MAKRLRRYTAEANDALTIPEFFEVRFGDKTGILRTLTSFITIFFVVFYVSSGLVGGSKLLESILGVEGDAGHPDYANCNRILYLDWWVPSCVQD